MANTRKTLIGLLALLLLSETAFSQKEDDNLISVTVSDTSNLYQRVRHAITYTDFIIRIDSGKDTLITYSERLDRTSIFVVAKVVISGNKVEISGAFGLGLQDFWGEPRWPTSYKRISYVNKGTDTWIWIRRIALKLDGKIEYLKVR